MKIYIGDKANVCTKELAGVDSTKTCLLANANTPCALVENELEGKA